MIQSFHPKRGAIAAGHPLTAAAGAQMLEQGGNAVDAAVAATFATFISEYTLSAPGGGGFALVYDAASGSSQLLDFFSTGPGLGRLHQPWTQDIDFQEITVDYGPSRQHFYVGRGAVAAPGNIAGLCSLAKQAGRLPLPVLLEPAIRLAREGCPISEIQAFIGGLIEPILLLTPECAAIFGRPEGGLRPAGDLVRMPALGDTLEALGREGPRLFYYGDVAQAILADQQANGGLLTAADLERYRVRRYRPLTSTFRQFDVLTNPPPSRGGLLITFALRLLDAFPVEATPFGSANHLELLAEAMRVTHLARRELEAQALLPRQQIARLLGPATVARWQGTLRNLLARPVAERALDAAPPAMPSTTQISVMDEDGLVVSLTTSGGEGAGFIVPGTGVILNNMLGEADLHPQGFHRSPPGLRIPSMMAPTVVLRDGTPLLSLGSGGANRIRSAIVQVLLNSLAFQLPLAQAVAAPRIHFEEGVMQVEAGNDPVAVDALAAAGYTVNRWQARHMFFGGAHAVARTGDGFAAVGDARRGGAAMISER
ncbi:MAG TPA: gamma-glutamyltransferase [Anaerolineae bacterium]|nr:gamma-glutamyltransferase [Anaerolineae bacterium]